ncbi:hypothetical protein ACFPRL_12525 [Pseudoclavibacter helvolus]
MSTETRAPLPRLSLRTRSPRTLQVSRSLAPASRRATSSTSRSSALRGRPTGLGAPSRTRSTSQESSVLS